MLVTWEVSILPWTVSLRHSIVHKSLKYEGIVGECYAGNANQDSKCGRWGMGLMRLSMIDY